LPKPRNSGEAVWGLSAYPVSAAFRARVESALGSKLDVTVLSEMRSAGVIGVLRALISVRRARALVLMEDESGEPVVPVLRFLVSLSRCRALATAGPDAAIVPFTRRRGLVDGARLVAGSLSGALAAARAAIELAWLRRQRRQRVRVGPIRRIAYLKTNLWFGLKAGARSATLPELRTRSRGAQKPSICWRWSGRRCSIRR
jgi:hypothetical protein